MIYVNITSGRIRYSEYLNCKCTIRTVCLARHPSASQDRLIIEVSRLIMTHHNR